MQRKDKMNLKDAMKYMLPEEVYSVVTVIYLFRLNHLNKQLKSMNFDNPFELLAYEKFTPILYVIIAGVLVFASTQILLKRYRQLKYTECSFREIVFIICLSFWICILLVLILVFIDNPILRAILSALIIARSLIFLMVEN